MHLYKQSLYIQNNGWINENISKEMNCQEKRKRLQQKLFNEKKGKEFGLGEYAFSQDWDSQEQRQLSAGSNLFRGHKQLKAKLNFAFQSRNNSMQGMLQSQKSMSICFEALLCCIQRKDQAYQQFYKQSYKQTVVSFQRSQKMLVEEEDYLLKVQKQLQMGEMGEMDEVGEINDKAEMNEMDEMDEMNKMVEIGEMDELDDMAEMDNQDKNFLSCLDSEKYQNSNQMDDNNFWMNHFLNISQNLSPSCFGEDKFQQQIKMLEAEFEELKMQKIFQFEPTDYQQKGQ